MKSASLSFLSALVLTAGVPAVAYTHVRPKGPSKPMVKHAAVKTKLQTPRGIEDDRATQLQNALIHAGYMTGEPSGHWDTASGAAMQKLQADNGWQTKLVPDSRAIIKLGLGPSTAYASNTGGDGAAQPGTLATPGNPEK